ncbi:MAG TPA: MarP family serine protease [Acidimicrobiales bacterium]
MDTLDVVVLLLAILAAVGGYRIGFVARAASWVGMALGIVIAIKVLPSLSSSETDARRLLVLGLIIVFAGAIIGQVLGLVLGAQLRMVIPPGNAQNVDRVGGAAAGVVGVMVGYWLLLPILAQTPQWPAQQARNSAIASFIHDHLPAAPDTTQALRRALGPQVFEGFGPAPALGAPPVASGLTQQTADRVAQSTVKVEAPACSRVQEGSGSVVGPDLIATNAHVVAGSPNPTVLRHPDNAQLDATVVAFDSDRDIAILQVPGLDRPALPLGQGPFGVGGDGAVFGHPLGGPLTLSPFEVAQSVDARGFDIYDQHHTTRSIFVLSSDLAPGDSGGALVDASGTVEGVAFAIAPDQPHVGYALTLQELDAVLAGDLSHAVSTGPCIG